MRTFLMLMLGAFLFTGCGASLSQVAANHQGQSIAVVSLSINDLGGSLQGWNSTRTSDLMMTNAATMQGFVEQQLASRWTVVPAASYVGRPEYQALVGPASALDVALPMFAQGPMPVFGDNRNDLIRARIPAAKVQQMASITGADLIAVVYVEWGVATGGFIPTSKALSKNVMSIFDAQGNEIFHGRVDIRGDRTLGAFGHVVVDVNSIQQWIDAFGTGMQTMIAR